MGKEREQHATHSFSVISCTFEIFFSGTVTIPESHLAKEDSLG